MTERQPVHREAAPDAVQVAKGTVEPTWVDASGVMAAERYAAVFARGREGLVREHLGLSAPEHSRFRVVKSASQHRRALHARDRYRIDARMLGWNSNYLHVFFQLWHGDEIAAACQELLRYTQGLDAHEAEMPADAQTAAARLYRNQEGLPLPLGADRAIVLPQETEDGSQAEP